MFNDSIHNNINYFINRKTVAIYISIFYILNIVDDGMKSQK